MTNNTRSVLSFYRNVDSIDECNKFPNQTSDPRSAVYEDHEMFLGVDDTQPGLYASENREILNFDLFKGSEKSVSYLKKNTPKYWWRGRERFFFLTQKKEGGKEKPRRERAKEVVREKFYEELLEI